MNLSAVKDEPDDDAWAPRLARDKVYGASPLCWRTLAAHLVCEVGWVIVGPAMFPVMIALIGRGGVISCGFWPGKYACGSANTGVFVSQLVTFVLMLPISLELVYKLTLPTHNNQSFDVTVDLLFVLLIIIIRSVMIAVKYAFAPKSALRAMYLGQMTGARFRDLLMVAFASQPRDAILFDQLDVAFHGILVRPLSGHLFLREELPQGTVAMLAENYEAARREHAQSFLETPSLSAGNREGPRTAPADTPAATPPTPSVEEDHEAGSSSVQERQVPVRHLAFFLVQTVYKKVNARTLPLRASHLATLHLLADGSVAAMQVLQAADFELWGLLVKSVAVLFRFIFMRIMYGFLISAITNLRRSAAVAKTLLGLLEPDLDETYALRVTNKKGQIGTVRLDPYMAANVYGWGALALMLSNFGRIFNLRFSFIFGVYLMLWAAFCVATFASFVLDFEWIEWNSFAIYSADSLSVALLLGKAMLFAAETNFYIQTRYVQMLETLRTRMNALRFYCSFPSMDKILLTARAPLDEVRVSSRDLPQGAGSRESGVAATRVSHAIRAVDLMSQQVRLHPPIEILGRVITSKSLQRSLAGIVSVFMLVWNVFRYTIPAT